MLNLASPCYFLYIKLFFCNKNKFWRLRRGNGRKVTCNALSLALTQPLDDQWHGTPTSRISIGEVHINKNIIWHIHLALSNAQYYKMRSHPLDHYAQVNERQGVVIWHGKWSVNRKRPAPAVWTVSLVLY